jgi:glycosyltransferase involved in cell wall biosynthesis
VLRKGEHKRLDLYLAFIALVRQRGDFRIAVISPEDDIIESLRGRVAVCLARPSLTEMRAIYARSKCFVHLSDHEGFGLPPLEAMGAGCVPLCRDSGGVRAFMKADKLEPCLFPLTLPIDSIVQIAIERVQNVSRLRACAFQCRDVFRGGLDIEQRRGDGIDTFLQAQVQCLTQLM